MKEFLDRLRKSGYAPLAVIAAVPLVFAALLYGQYKDTNAQLDRAYGGEKVMDARLAAMRVRHFLEGERDNLASFAGALSLAGDVGRGKGLAEAQFGSGLRKRKLISFFVMDGGGRFLYSAPEPLIDRRMQDLSREGYFVQPVGKRGFSMSAAQPDSRDGWEVVLSVPVYERAGGGERGRLLGVAAERIDVRALEDALTGGEEGAGGGYTVLVDDGGRVLAGARSGMLYQVENSSPLLQKMIGGEEGAEPVGRDGAGGGVGEGGGLLAFSPVVFEGRVWSVGVISPTRAAGAGARKGLVFAALLFAGLALALSWGALSFASAGGRGPGPRERERLSGSLAIRRRELATLGDLAKAMGSGEDVDGLLRSALAIIKADTGASGVAVRLVTPRGGGLALAAGSGMPDEFAGAGTCPLPGGCHCAKVMEGGVPAVLEMENRGAGEWPACHPPAPGGLVMVPLAAKDGPVGVLYLSGLREKPDGERLKFLGTAGEQLAAWLDNLMRVEDANRNAAMAGALFNTAQALTRSLDLDELLRIIMTEAASLLKAGRCILMLYNEEQNRVDCRMALGFDCHAPGQSSFSPSGVFWEAMEDGGVKVVGPRERKQEVPAEFAARFGLSSFILVTLTSKGRVLGFLVLDTAGRERAVPDELKLIVGFANQAALAIETSSYYIRTVERYNEDLQRLSGRIIEAQEEERKRISRDLHDELGQVLTAVKINLDLVAAKLASDPNLAGGRLEDAIALTGSALDGVRRLSFELRPPMLDDLGLGTVLGKLIADFRKRSGMEVEFTLEGPDERLPQGMEVTLYRVVQEALTNALRHSSASSVKVRLARDPAKGMVGLYIEDDGAGFEPGGENGGGFGLMGIRERVSLLGGNFRVFAGEGKGVRLLVDIPWNKGD